MSDPTIPSFSTRLWSDEVGLADPEAGIVVHGGSYSFSSGRVRSDNTLYDPRPEADIECDCAATTASVGGRVASLAGLAEHVISHAASSTANSGGAAVAGVYLDTAVSSNAIAASGGSSHAALQAVVGSFGAVSLRNGARSAAMAAIGSGAVSTTRSAGGRVAAAATGGAATLFVAPTGSNSNDGTSILTPFLTIAKAASVATAGDVVQLADGNYSGGLVTSCAGTVGNPITFIAASLWGARIIPPTSSSTDIAWQSNGAYVVIDGIEIDGSTDPLTGSRWRIGLRMLGQGSSAQNCHVHHIFRNGVENSNGGAGILMDSNNGGQNMRATNNLVHHIGAAAGGAGLWFHGLYQTASGSASENIVCAVSGAAIHCWHDVRNLTISHNTVFASQVGIIYGGGDYVHLGAPCDYMTVKDNIVYANGTGIRELGDNGTHNVVTNNLCNSNATNYQLAVSSHSADKTGNPLFVNYQADGSGDYRLGVGSPALGTASDGANVGAL